jgi:hypothetical protein
MKAAMLAATTDLRGWWFVWRVEGEGGGGKGGNQKTGEGRAVTWEAVV